MNQNKLLFVFALFLSVFLPGIIQGQYANKGTGQLKDQIWWFDWSVFALANGASKNFQTSNGLEITITFSNISGPELVPSPMNTWSGAVLHLLYDFTDPTMRPALYNSSDVTAKTAFNISVTAKRNGSPVAINFIMADAEASDLTEITTLTTNGSEWTTIDFFRNSLQTSNPVSGCGSRTIKLTDTYGNAPALGQNPVLSTQSPSVGPLSINVTLDHTNGSGFMGLAFGVLEGVDRGDLPASYGHVQHQLSYTIENGCNYLPPYPKTNQISNLRIGTLPGDADGQQTDNDNGNGGDEDAITALPLYSGTGIYQISLPVINSSSANAFIGAWFDFNRNGRFEDVEKASASVAPNTTSVTLTWNGVPAKLERNINYAFRFRISSEIATVQNAAGTAKDGEVEDYFVLIPQQTTTAFIIPDTVCVNTPVEIENTSTGTTNYYWNFCVADLKSAPSGENIGNVGGNFSLPVFMDYVFYKGNYYGFLTNNNPGSLIRLDFGNSLLNNPTSVNLGNFNGILPTQIGTEGIQMVFNEGRWYAIIVSGHPPNPGSRKIIKIDFGADVTNTNPSATDWGNLGGLTLPVDLHVFKEGDVWYGLTVNADNNTITRINFTNSFTNIPTAENLGNIGNLSYPTGIYAINDNGFWRVFVVNGGNNTRTNANFSLTRLDFGSSLLNTPTGVNLGNPGNKLQHPRDLTILKQCGQIIGFAVNGSFNNSDMVQMDFGNDLTSIPQMTSLGIVGNSSFPHSISKLFRVKDDVYGFITNVDNNTVTRLKFSGCTNASISSSQSQHPAPVVYDKPGIYNINLTTDEGLPTQGSYCRQVVVVAAPVIAARSDTTICPGEGVQLKVTASGAIRFSWSPSKWLSDSSVADPLAKPDVTTEYIVTAFGVGGCSTKDTLLVTVRSLQQCKQVIASFTAPDTVCVNTPVAIKNTSMGASNYYWNFCVANASTNPVGTNLGNFGFTLSVFIDYAKEGNNYYGFVTNNMPGKLVRLDFGNSLLNTPTVHDYGNLGGVIPDYCEGIQLIKNEGRWYAIIVGDQPVGRIVKVDFGASLANKNPVATNWGNVGNLAFPTDLHLFQNGSDWFGLTINSQTNTITRFNFTNSFTNKPTGVNLGNIGNLNYPTGIYAISKGGTWHAFVTNQGGAESNSANASITRLDFGSSLLNTPTGVNLGNPGNALRGSRDITIYQSCNEIFGFVVNNSVASDMVRLNFNNSLTAIPTATSIGNTGNFSFPHCISKLFRVENDLYSFVANVNNNTITRLKLEGCNGGNITPSTKENPDAVIYSQPGIYNINLTADEGLPTQAVYCKQIVVLGAVHTPLQVKTICEGDSVLLSSSTATVGDWNDGTTSRAMYAKSSGTYWIRSVTSSGCINVDSFAVIIKPMPVVNLGTDTAFCEKGSMVLDAGNNGASYAWQNGLVSKTFTAIQAGTYHVAVTKDGCTAKDTVLITVKPLPKISVDGITSICKDGSTVLLASGGESYTWFPSSDLSTASGPSTVAKPPVTTNYFVKAIGMNGCVDTTSVTIIVKPKPVFTAFASKPILCIGDTVSLTASGGDRYTWSPGTSLGSQNNDITTAFPRTSTLYKVVIEEDECKIEDSLFVNLLVTDKPVGYTTKSNDINCFIGYAALKAGGGTQYLWQPVTGLSDPTSSQPIARINTTTTYKVAITTAEGCTLEDSITVYVNKGDDGSGFPVPTAFTPNGDGRNDCFGVRYWGDVTGFSMALHNRWGQVVFQSEDPSQCWNGKVKGQLQPTDVYVYIIKAKTICGNIFRKGTLTLIR